MFIDANLYIIIGYVVAVVINIGLVVLLLSRKRTTSSGHENILNNQQVLANVKDAASQFSNSSVKHESAPGGRVGTISSHSADDIKADIQQLKNYLLNWI